MARLKTADKELAILEAASRVFAQRPFHEVLIDHIASDAGIGKGTIYRYFETKDDLYFNAVLHVLDTLTAALDSALSDDMTAARRLEVIATVILAHFWNRRKMIEFFQREEHFAMRHEELASRREGFLRFIQGAILSGIERREFRGIDARIGANLFLGMVRSVNLFHASDDRLEDLVGQVMGVFLAGVARGDAS
jgi:TetR/AcrR family fatty acid metabolism transcriptional regulator